MSDERIKRSQYALAAALNNFGFNFSDDNRLSITVTPDERKKNIYHIRLGHTTPELSDALRQFFLSMAGAPRLDGHRRFEDIHLEQIDANTAVLSMRSSVDILTWLAGQTYDSDMNSGAASGLRYIVSKARQVTGMPHRSSPAQLTKQHQWPANMASLVMAFALNRATGAKQEDFTIFSSHPSDLYTVIELSPFMLPYKRAITQALNEFGFSSAGIYSKSPSGKAVLFSTKNAEEMEAQEAADPRIVLKGNVAEDIAYIGINRDNKLDSRMQRLHDLRQSVEFFLSNESKQGHGIAGFWRDAVTRRPPASGREFK